MIETRSETVFSLTGEVPALSQISTRADTGALHEATLVRGSARICCRLRKISGGGALLHIPEPVRLGERIDVALMNGVRFGGTVIWQEGEEVGLRFDTPVDIFALIARDLVRQAGDRRRLPRIEVRADVRIEKVEGVQLAAVRDISQAGMQVEQADGLLTGDAVALTLDGVEPIRGEVRWTEGDRAGIAFAESLSWEKLMPWLARRRDQALRRPSTTWAILPPGAGGAQSSEADFTPALSLNLPARAREGTRRWSIDVTAITTQHVEFDTFAALQSNALLWLVLPGLEGWPARVVQIDGYHFTCMFTQPLHPAVLERVLGRTPTQ